MHCDCLLKAQKTSMQSIKNFHCIIFKQYPLQFSYLLLFSAYMRITGIISKSTLGLDSVSLMFLLSQPAPSKYSPYTQTPSEGGLVISSFIHLVTSLHSTTLSRAHPLLALVISCPKQMKVGKLYFYMCTEPFF